MREFEEYKRLGEPDALEKSLIWQTAIGLQQADHLTPSKYLIETAKKNIEGKISISEVKERLDAYYKTQPASPPEDRTEEADKVSARITEVLGEKTFSFGLAEYLAIHRRLFTGILSDLTAGKIRTYNVSKPEAVLNGESVFYSGADIIKATLEHDFEQEKKFNYRGLSKREIAEHVAKFTSGIWQIHAFGEGNTRTTAVFIIKYQRTRGVKNVGNDLFAENSLYFRNALVRANYDDYVNNVHSTMEYLHRFFGNLLLGENNALDNREMRIDTGTTTQKPPGKHPKNTRKTPGKHPENTRKILNTLALNPFASRQELAKKLEMTEDKVRWDMNKLRKSGKIQRVGPDKGGYWKIMLI